MADNLGFKGLFRGLFVDSKNPTPVAPIVASDVATTAKQFPVKNSKPRSEAYLNRRKGPKKGSNFRMLIGEYLAAKGETTTAEMINDLKLPKSSLVYHLNQILEISQLDPVRFKSRYDKIYIEKLLGGKRLERVGGSKYVKYRLVEHPEITSTKPANPAP